MQRHLLALCLLCAVGCTARADTQGVPLPAAQTAFYRTALADAHSFIRKAIPAAMLPPGDRGNATYYEAYSAAGQLLGYLRDFSGPVSPSDSCACNPLSLTLVFDANRTFKTLISGAPLQKWGHAAMTDADTQRLIQILKDPPASLLQVRRVEDVVDATTGATKQALQSAVVAQAGLSTRRLVGLVRDTQDILRGAPNSRDRERLHAIIDSDKPKDQATQARELAAVLPAMESPESRRAAYHLMVNAYVLAQSQHAAPSPDVEAVLLDPGLAPDSAGDDIAHACYRLADRGLRLDVVRTCAAQLSASKAAVPPGMVAMLRGTERLAAGDNDAALPLLQEAARRISVNAQPELHLRLAQAYASAGQSAQACTAARGLWLNHSLMPGLSEALKSCAAPGHPFDAVVAELNQHARTALLHTGKARGLKAPSLSLETVDGQPRDVALAEPGKVTVAVFFATWCPHCRAELPRVKAFVDWVSSQPQWKNRVRVLGVRTAVEKESESYDTFKSVVAPNFPIYTDATMSLAFSHFAKVTGVPAALPTTAILDEQGDVRFFLEPGDFKDTRAELAWAVESLLPSDKK